MLRAWLRRMEGFPEEKFRLKHPTELFAKVVQTYKERGWETALLESDPIANKVYERSLGGSLVLIAWIEQTVDHNGL